MYVVAIVKKIIQNSSVFRKSQRGGQGLGGCHFTQSGRRTVVIGGTFRNNFSVLRAPEGALSPEKGFIVVVGHLRAPSNYIFPIKKIRNWRAPNNRKGRLRRLRGSMVQWAPLTKFLIQNIYYQKIKTSKLVQLCSKLLRRHMRRSRAEIIYRRVLLYVHGNEMQPTELIVRRDINIYSGYRHCITSHTTG